jgi:UDP-glucose/GDP-mannose dehydrogenase family, central domain
MSKPEVAEIMKLYENCQRMVCIAYANEMVDAYVEHDTDPFEVCKAMGRRAVEKFLRAHPENITNREVRILVVELDFKQGQSNLQISFADPLVKDIPIPFVRGIDEEREWNKASLSKST